MLIIKTSKNHIDTLQPIYKDYYVTTKGALKLTMEEIYMDRMNNDISRYTPIFIYDIIDTEEK